MSSKSKPMAIPYKPTIDELRRDYISHLSELPVSTLRMLSEAHVRFTGRVLQTAIDTAMMVNDKAEYRAYLDQEDSK